MTLLEEDFQRQSDMRRRLAVLCANDDNPIPTDPFWRKLAKERLMKKLEAHKHKRVTIPDWFLRLPRPQNISLNCARALAESAAYFIKVPDPVFVRCTGGTIKNGMAIFLRGETFKVTLSCALIALALSGCAANDETVVRPNFRPQIIQAKADCAAKHYPNAHRNFERVKCENISLRNMARPELNDASFYAFDNFLTERLSIADQVDRHKITPEQSDVAILEAQSRLLNGSTEQNEAP